MSGRTQPLRHVPGLLDLARRQVGVVGRRQLAELGVSREHVRSQLRAQRWQAVGPHVVALLTGPLNDEQWRWSASLHTSPDGVLCELTALEVHGLVGWPSPRPQVLLPHGRRVADWPALVLRRSRDLPDEDVCECAGLPCTTPERSALDAATRSTSPRAASALVLAVVQQRITTVRALAGQLERGPANRRHAGVIRAALGSAAGGADSLAEVDAADLLRRAGLGAIRRQVVLDTPRGPRRVDLLAELPDGSLLAVEVDGVHHSDPAVRATDAEKDAVLLATGIRVLRLPVAWLRQDPEAVLAHLRRIATGSAFAGQGPRSHHQWR